MLCDVYFLFVFSLSLSLSLSLLQQHYCSCCCCFFVVVVLLLLTLIISSGETCNSRAYVAAAIDSRLCGTAFPFWFAFAICADPLTPHFGCCSAWAGHRPGRWCNARFRHQRQSTFVGKRNAENLEQQTLLEEKSKSTRRI